MDNQKKKIFIKYECAKRKWSKQQYNDNNKKFINKNNIELKSDRYLIR